MNQVDPFTIKVGDVYITRKYIQTEPVKEGNFAYYTFISKNINNEQNSLQSKAKASIAVLHGNAENSDHYIDLGMHHAMNDFEVHLVDLKGWGMSSGQKNSHYKIQE